MILHKHRQNSFYEKFTKSSRRAESCISETDNIYKNYKKVQQEIDALPSNCTIDYSIIIIESLYSLKL